MNFIERFLNACQFFLDKSSVKYESAVSGSNLAYTHKVFIAITITFIISIFIFSQVEIDISVSTRGEILLSTDIEKVQHLEGGILDKLYIYTGEKVVKGQPIARLRSIGTSAQLKSSSLDILSKKLDLERYKSLISGQEPQFWKISQNVEMNNIAKQSWQKEALKNTSNEKVIKHDIEHKTTIIQSMSARLESSGKQLELIREQLEIKEKLYKEELASYMDVLGMRVQEMNMIREMENLVESIKNEKFQKSRFEKQLFNTIATRNSEYQEKINTINKELALKKAEIPEHKDKVERLTLYSPIDGIVDKIHFNYKSAIIPPRESIADISPLNNELHGEIKISRKEIGFVEIGQNVNLKFDTFNFTKYGFITGHISSISRSSYMEEEEEFFLAKIKLDKNFLEKNNVKYKVAPYMEFTADITTGSRKIIDYVVKPIMSAIESSFDER